MRPQNRMDWIAFAFLLVGAFSWLYFVTDQNILDLALERIWDPLDDWYSSSSGCPAFTRSIEW